MSASIALFSAIAFVIFYLGREYLFGIRIYQEGIGLYHPLKTIQENPAYFTPFTDIELLELDEAIELHRTGRKLKRFNVYRIRIRKPGSQLELLAEMTGLMPSEINKFRQLPDILVENQLLPEAKINRQKLSDNQI
jgi:hypothetical protein